jgi:hypothetical protein
MPTSLEILRLGDEASYSFPLLSLLHKGRKKTTGRRTVKRDVFDLQS